MNPHKQRQVIIASVIGSVVAAIAFILLYVFFKDDFVKNKNKVEEVRKISFDLPGKSINKQEVWMHKMESQSKIQDKKIELLGSAIDKQSHIPKDTSEVEGLKKDIEDLKKFVTSKNDVPALEQEKAVEEPSIKKYELKLTHCGGTISNTIPAGGFSKAVLLSSVDASVGVSVSADPQPVALRVLDRGILPNNFQSRLKRCVLIASARGDLSSERVYMRLEKLSCIESDGKVIETDISGYVSGEDGKAGLKGNVVDRSGPMVGGAVLSGFFTGMNQCLQTSLTHAAMQDPKVGSNTNTTLLSPELFKSGGVQGISNAFDKLAEYYIKRAEQLQPVVQVESGRRVDVIFTKSARIGSKEKREALHD